MRWTSTLFNVFFFSFLMREANGRYIQNDFLKVNAAILYEQLLYQSWFKFLSRLFTKHCVKPAVCFIEVRKIYCHFCLLAYKMTLWLCFFSSWEAGFRLIYTTIYFLLSTHSKLEQRKHEQTSALIYIHEKLKNLNKIDSCEPNYALKCLVQEQSICLSL